MWTKLGPKEVTVPSVSSNSAVSIDRVGSLTLLPLGDDSGEVICCSSVLKAEMGLPPQGPQPAPL